MTQESMLKVCKSVLIPFMKKTRSKKVIFDCTTVYHNSRVYSLLRENGIEPYPSAGMPFRTEGGYPPNSHDCMPNELINDRLKENVRKAFDKLCKNRQTMKRLQTYIKREAAKFDKKFVRDRIADLPMILTTIEHNKGGRTKY